jgi:tRNA pseudouridine38-40 synthase
LIRNLRLIIEFDGAEFFGWQRQPTVRTVEGVLTKTIESIVQHDVRVAATSRTDRGVHALGLPVGFETSMDISDYGLLRGLNSRLPEDLKVHEIKEMPSDWRVRWASVAKTYIYRFQVGKMPFPLWRRRSYYIKRPMLDVDAMIAAAPRLEGIHDFGAFRAAQCQATQTIRKMHSVRVRRTTDPDIVELEITGSGFLQYMVRIMAGTLLQVGIGQRKAESINELLESGDRTLGGPTLPPHGLTLVKVFFDGYPKFAVKNEIQVD